MSAALAVVLLAGSFFVAGCRGGAAQDAPPATATTRPVDTATAVVPTATPTPDPLTTVPTSQAEAEAMIEKALGPDFSPPCPDSLLRAGIGCAGGEATGDGANESAYLVPVKGSSKEQPYSSTVFIWSSQSKKLEPFAADLTADSSILGHAFFQMKDRTGDGRADLSYIQNTCGATGCSSRAVVLSWDGTAWRDVGPGEAVSNVDAISWDESGSASVLVIHGGKLPPEAPPESGPTRASTTRYTLTTGRYGVSEVAKDPPEYLYHAVEDADSEFSRDLAGSQAAYKKVIESTGLKDWKLKADDPDRRPSLAGYAMFRLATIDAALGKDPTVALDRVIRESKEPLFVYLAEAFRNGYQARGGVVGGCAEANLYLRTPQAGGADPGAYVAQLFNYGYANPPGSKWMAKLCPF
jgi:hypothetical protein